MTTLSFFSGYFDVHSIGLPLDHIVEMIRHNQSVKENTGRHRHLRATGEEKPARLVKECTPCFAVPVRFRPEGKAKQDMTDLTGLSLVDLDHIPAGRMEEVVRLVQADPHTLLAYVTISGEGLRILFRIEGLAGQEASEANLKLYAKGFHAGNRHYAELTGCAHDPKCRNATRLSGLAHDPDVFYNPEAKAFIPHGKLKMENGECPSKGRKLSKRLLDAISRELDAQGVVYEAQHHNEYIMRTGYLLNAYGVNPEAATEWAVKQFVGYDGDVAGILRSCYRQVEQFGSRKLSPKSADKEDGDPRPGFASVEEMEDFLDTQARFRHNVVTGKGEYQLPPCEGGFKGDVPSEGYISAKNCPNNTANGTSPLPPSQGGDGYIEIDDRFLNTLWRRICKQVKKARIADLRAVLASEYVPAYNPFAAYFEALPPWDGETDYIAGLADSVTVDDGEQELFRRYFRKWIVAMVASLLKPEVVNNEILVLIGRQGTYKTTWMRYLLPPGLRRYFYVKTDSSRFSKDDLFSLTEFAIICLEEIDAQSRQETNQLKGVVTKPEVNERAAYGHFKERRPHLASFCGTTNKKQFLTDLSGTRRWLPFVVKDIREPYRFPVNYTGVYSQALALFRSGFNYNFLQHEVEEVNLRNRRFELPSMELELVQKMFRVPMEGEAGALFFTATDILQHINMCVKCTLKPENIEHAMERAGYPLMETAGRSGYRVIVLSGDRIMENARAMARFV